MSKLAFFAPDKDLFLQGKKIIHELGLENTIVPYLVRLKSSTRLAEKLQSRNVDAIICRGGTAQALINSQIQIPVVEIKVNGQDLARLFHEAKIVTGLTRPKVAMLAFSNMIHDANVLSQILDIDLTIYLLQSLDEIPDKIEIISKTDTDVIAGGISAVILAKRNGLKAVLVRSGDYSIRAAVLEAQKIALGRKIEKEQFQKFKVLVDYSPEGIVSVNAQNIIEVFNPAAERVLKYLAKDAIGKKIDSVLAFIDTATCLSTGKQLIGQTVQLNNAWITFNIAPIIVDKVIFGAIVTFLDITQVQEVAAKIRNQVLVKNFYAKYRLEDIIGISEEITECKRISREIAQIDATILITGESGTGKELFAQSIHNESHRRKGPFVAVNCAALPAALLESQLFGYVEGAFTGATKKGKPGLFEMAHKGTLLLDEISEIDLHSQSRLLRVLQEKQVMRLGDDKYTPVDTRIIVATNKNLATAVREGKFRHDLFYRLKVLTLNIPPLCKRTGDIEHLCEYFCQVFNTIYNKRLKIEFPVYDRLNQYDWPGNVRELMHFVERMVIIANETTISMNALPKYWDNQEVVAARPSCESASNASPEKIRITEALDKCDFNITRAAQLLDIDRGTLYHRLRKYNIEIKKAL